MAQLVQSLDKILGQGIDAALALDQLHQDGAYVVPGGGLDGLQSGLGIAEALYQRGKILAVELILTGGGERSHGAAVEGVGERQNGAAARAVFVIAVFPGHLDEAFVALGAGVAEKHTGHAAAPAQLLSQQGAGLGIEQVGDVAQLADLLHDGRLPLIVGGTHGVDADAGAEVDIFLACLVIQRGVFAMVDIHVVPPIGVNDILAVQGLQFFMSHRAFSAFHRIMVPTPWSENISMRME